MEITQKDAINKVSASKKSVITYLPPPHTNDEKTKLKRHIDDALSYAQKLVTVRLGGVLKLLDPVLELNPLNDFGQSICAAELPPFLLG